MVHEGLAAIPISLLPIKVIECVAYPPLSKAPWEVAPAFLPNLPISHSLRLGSDTDTGLGGISGGNYFPAFPPTCRAWEDCVDNADDELVIEKASLV